MANEYVLCDKEDLVAIADAVRANSGTSQTFSVSELKEAAIANMGTNTQDLLAVYNEINLKTGLSDCNTPEQAMIDIASLSTGFKINDVPTYVQTEAKRVANLVQTAQNSRCLTWIAMSDTHHGNGAYDSSITHLAQAAKIICDNADIDFIAHMGDVVTGAASDSLETHLNNHMNALRTFSICAPTLRLVGNHDANAYNPSSYLSASDTNKYIGRFATSVIKPNTEAERGYYYYDIEDKGVRVICLNSADLKDLAIGNIADGHYISATQLQWLVSTALDLTGKESWKVLVFAHHPIHWYGSMLNVLTILEAYKAGTSGSVTVNGTIISYNFSGKNAATLIGTFHGHTHNFIYGYAGNSDILRMGTPNGCFTRSNEYGSSSYNEDFRSKYGDTTTYSKTANSKSDTAFVVNILDYDAQTVRSIHYGAGPASDRVLSYAGIPYYNITTTLPSSLSINNTTASIKQGESYIAELIPSDGYSIKSVIITMGGTDVTSSAYSDGIINISEVTGDITIIATVTGYTNIIDTIGYTDGKRLSTSTGNLSTQSGYVTTGMIDLGGVSNNHVIRTKGVDFRTANKAYCAYVFYADASGTFKNSGYLNAAETASISISFDDEGNLTFVLKPQVGARYLKICGYGSGANLIVTINEEITENGGTEAPEEPDAPAKYTNLVSTSLNADGTAYESGKGYKENYRLSSSGNESSTTGAVVTGFIPYSRQVVRVYGSPEAGSYTGQYLGLYNSSHTKIQVYSPGHGGITSEQVNNKYLFTYDPAKIIAQSAQAQGFFDSAAYIRVSAANCAGSDLVVTFNEEIV